MRSRLLTWPVLGIAAVVVAAALFGGGLVAGKALGGDDDAAPASTDDGNVAANLLPLTGPFAAGGTASDGDIVARSSTPANQAAADGAASPDSLARGGYGGALPPGYYGCEALLGDVLQGTTLNPASAGITPTLLGPGFQLVRLSMWAEGDCGSDGQPVTGKPVLESTWRHTETGATLTVDQRLLGEAVANVRYDTSATFVVDGYVFYVSAWNNVYYAEDGQAGAPDKGSDVASAGIVPPADQADVKAALDAALGQLAPSLPSTCYYVQTQGDWSDLPGLGVGDPRSAIPAGFKESNFNLYTFAAPDASCPDNGAEPPHGNSFWAQWTGEDGSSYLEVNVYNNDVAVDDSWPGNLDEWGANWTHDGVSYGVWGSNQKGGLGADVIAAVALALDPGFSSQCLIALTPLDASDLAAIGINTPSATGFVIGKTSLNRRGVDPACPNASQYADSTSYELNWSLESDDGQIQVYAWISGSSTDTGTRWGNRYDGGLEWGYGNRNFSVWSDIGDKDSLRDSLIEVATSLDPQFDIDSLTDSGGYPKPLPIEPDAASDSGGAASAAESATR